MSTSKFLVGTLVGGIVYFILGFLVYAIILEGFFAAHAGTATGVMKTDEMQYWPLVLGNFGHAALLSFVFLKWANIKTFGAGLGAGFILGFLMAFGFDLVMYDTSNIMDLTAAIVDPIAYAVISGIVGGVIGGVVGMGKQS